MFNRRQWQVEPGLGGERLETIQSQVLLSNALRPYIDDLEAQADFAAEDTRSWIAQVSREAVKSDDVLKFLRDETYSLPEAELRRMVFGIVAGGALVLAKNISLDVRSFDQEIGKRAAVTASGIGVRNYTAKIGLETDLERIAEKSRPLQPDQRLSGTVAQFDPNPSRGGLIVLMNRGVTHHVLGLVNAATGDPRVNLEIMSQV